VNGELPRTDIISSIFLGMEYLVFRMRSVATKNFTMKVPAKIEFVVESGGWESSEDLPGYLHQFAEIDDQLDLLPK